MLYKIRIIIIIITIIIILIIIIIINHYYNKTVERCRLIISTHETSEGVISLKPDLNFYILMVVI